MRGLVLAWRHPHSNQPSNGSLHKRQETHRHRPEKPLETCLCAALPGPSQQNKSSSGQSGRILMTTQFTGFTYGRTDSSGSRNRLHKWKGEKQGVGATFPAPGLQQQLARRPAGLVQTGPQLLALCT